MAWMWFLTAPGYLLASALFAGFHALAAIAAPSGPWRVVGRPVAHTLAEAARFCFPFGGVPLASLAIGQAAGPFVGVVKVGGALLLTLFTEGLRNFGEWRLMIYSLLLIFILFFLPNGFIAPLWKRVRSGLGDRA